MATVEGQDARPVFFFDIDNCVSICLNLILFTTKSILTFFPCSFIPEVGGIRTSYPWCILMYTIGSQIHDRMQELIGTISKDGTKLLFQSSIYLTHFQTSFL